MKLPIYWRVARVGFLIVLVWAVGSGLRTEKVRGYTLTSFDPAVVCNGCPFPLPANALSQRVGVSGYLIEDFEDTTLIPGLRVEPSLDDLLDFGPVIWDGVQALRVDVREQAAAFRFPAGTTSIGIGIADVESPDSVVEIFVNNVSVGRVSDLPNYARRGNNGREVYLRVDMEPGDAMITSLGFKQLEGPRQEEFVSFDHLAIAQGDLPAIDRDHDGVPDTGDACPDSIREEYVVIDGCETGVSNTLFLSQDRFGHGCTISDEVKACERHVFDHDAFAVCVAFLASDLQAVSHLPIPDQVALVSCAAQADVPAYQP